MTLDAVPSLGDGGPAAEGVPSVNRAWDGTAVEEIDETREAEPVPANGNMTSGWYYLDSNVTKNGRIESIIGDVHLILGDGYTLDVKGIYVPAGSNLGQEASSAIVHRTDQAQQLWLRQNRD